MAERECGECSLCCKAIHVASLAKPTGEWCPHCRPGAGGCGIYDDRPGDCRDFRCLWLAGEFDEADRPDRVGAVLWMNGGELRTDDGVVHPMVNVSERHRGAAMASERCVALIENVLRRGHSVIVASAGRQSLVGLDKRSGRPRVLVEVPMVDGVGMTNVHVNLTVRASDGAITRAEIGR